MKAKDKRRLKIIEYLGNPENPPPTRSQLATAVGYKSRQALYVMFTPLELQEIEKEALEIRRTKYAGALIKVDEALLRQAMSGDLNAIKLVYQRFDDWAEIDQTKPFEAIIKFIKAGDNAES
jgi:hypothetical protein